MSDIGEVYRAMHEDRKAKRKDNTAKSSRIIRRVMENYADLTMVPKNNGVHLILSRGEKTIDFWPSTGKFLVRGELRYRRGVFKVLKELGIYDSVDE